MIGSKKRRLPGCCKETRGYDCTSQERKYDSAFPRANERDKESSAYSQIYNKIASGQELTASKKMLFARKTLKPIWNIKLQEWNKKLMSVD